MADQFDVNRLKKAEQIVMLFLIGGLAIAGTGWLFSLVGWIQQEWVGWFQLGLHAVWLITWLLCRIIPGNRAVARGGNANRVAQIGWSFGWCCGFFGLAIRLGMELAGHGN